MVNSRFVLIVNTFILKKKMLSHYEDNIFFEGINRQSYRGINHSQLTINHYLKLQSYLSKSVIHEVKRAIQSTISFLFAISIV